MGREQLEEDLKHFKAIKGVKSVLLYGSRVEGRAHERSDWDICLVAPDRDDYEVVKESWRKSETSRDDYDVHSFGELPLKIKKRIIDNHEILWKDEDFWLDMHLYRYRKIWNDQAKVRGVN